MGLYDTCDTENIYYINHMTLFQAFNACVDFLCFGCKLDVHVDNYALLV